jgi:hypothetical protein
MNAKTTVTLSGIFHWPTPIGYVGTQGAGKGTRYYLNGRRTTKGNIARKINEHYSKGGA